MHLATAPAGWPVADAADCGPRWSAPSAATAVPVWRSTSKPGNKCAHGCEPDAVASETPDALVNSLLDGKKHARRPGDSCSGSSLRGWDSAPGEGCVSSARW